MPEYIEREALLSELQEEIEFETSMYTEEQNKYFNMGLKCAIRDVKSQPAADVTEVVRCKNCIPLCNELAGVLMKKIFAVAKQMDGGKQDE